MKVRVTRMALVCISLILMGLIFTSQSIAADIDPGTLEGLWLFDESTGNVAKDSSGKGLDAKRMGNPKWVAGKFGKALEFDGAGAFIEIPAHENPSTAITVSAWVKSATPTWNQHGWVVEKRDAYMLHPVLGEINMGWIVCNGGCWNQPGQWTDGKIGPKDITQWHMYTGTFDSKSGAWKLYIDGKVESTLDLNKAKIVVDNGPIFIGQDTCCPPRWGAGSVDEVAIFNVALTEKEVQAIYEGFESALAVKPAGKLTTRWADIKTQD